MSFDIHDESGRKIGSVDKDPEIFNGPGSFTLRDYFGRPIGYIKRRFDYSGIFIGILLIILGVLLVPFILVYRKQKSALILLPAIAILTVITFKAGNGEIMLFTYALGLALRILLIYSVVQSPPVTIIRTFIGWAIVESLLVFGLWHFLLQEYLLFIMSFILILLITLAIGKYINRKMAKNPKIAVFLFALISTFISIFGVFLQEYSYYFYSRHIIIDLTSMSLFYMRGISHTPQLIFNGIALIIALPLLYLLPIIKNAIKDW